MVIDYITASLKSAWAAGGNTALMPASAIYYDRPQKPAQLAGFPYSSLKISDEGEEVRTVAAVGNKLVRYLLQVDAYVVQGMTGGTSSGDAITDAGNLLRAFQAILDFVPPNTIWYTLTGLLHCIPQPGATIEKDPELYLGCDVYKASGFWEFLVEE